ncbi:hypothetical protein SteCoe_10718 [Stentor coeruleus]|uniref:Uncharacterized protein n=1 Tax=Stentor coeruleus TaxID=5963 RepID=A0A1R2CEW7_9CILI|nr:hypothetical protein SteCoe_10718 [Stentor coeruleus]
MNDTFQEIDALLVRTNRIYVSYSALTLVSTGSLMSLTKYSRKTKIFLTLTIAFPTSGLFTWAHILKTFSRYELTYLKVGLDKTYPSIKSDRTKS